MNFAGYNCRPGRVVRVNLPSLNMLGEFIVSDWSMGDSEGCTVQVKQYEAAIFDDAVGEPYNPIGFINLPAGGLGSPTGLTWTQNTGAEVVQGVLSWAPPTGIVSSYVVIVRQGATAVQSHSVPATSTQCAINGLPSGNYTMSVAAVGPMARSGEATLTVSIMGPPIPESCVVQSSIDSIVLIPQNTLHGLNGGTYEYFFSTSPTATAADADYLGQGLSFTHTGLAFYTNYYYFVRSSNAYGKSSFLYVPAATSNDVSAYLAALAGRITETELGQDLLEEIQKIPGLQEQIDALGGLKDYDPDATYAEYDLVVVGKRIYQATGAVPTGTPPPNPAYWLDVGQSVETANGLAQQVATNTTKISEIDGELTSQAESFRVLQAAVREDDGSGDLAGAIKDWTSTAAIAAGEKVRVTSDDSLARRIIEVSARVGDNSSKITLVEQAAANNQQATAQQLSQLNTTVGGQQTAIQQNTSIINDVNGRVAASWSVKMQYNSGTGQYIAAGIGLGIENGPAGLQSQFLVSADRFAIVNTVAGGAVSVPFAVQGGQVFMSSTFIMDGTITNAKIGSYISSTNYVAGQSGWILNKDGTLEINGMIPGQGRLVINSQNVSVYDANNVLRVRLGYLG